MLLEQVKYSSLQGQRIQLNKRKVSAFSVVSSGFYVQSPTAECIVVGKK
jgi:hypothetical protein